MTSTITVQHYYSRQKIVKYGTENLAKQHTEAMRTKGNIIR